MTLESTIEVTAGLVPRHYVLHVQAAVSPADMVELMQALALDDVDDDTCGGFFGKLRAACAEAYSGDLPQPIGAPIQPDDGDRGGDGEGGVPAGKP